MKVKSEHFSAEDRRKKSQWLMGGYISAYQWLIGGADAEFRAQHMAAKDGRS
ncbi:MAG: hypothetical protein ACQEWR_20465 [Bacillota bacterium]